jgi:dTDP-4-amino-4,6-dideoxy-D-galactose acyltransferase
MGQPCEFLPWDSEFFGRRIARVAARRLDRCLADAVLSFARRERIDCLYFLADSDDACTVRAAEDNGFRLMDVRVTLEWAGGATGEAAAERPDGSGAPGRDAPCLIRPASEADLPGLEAIARTAHRDSRFYCDPGFPEERCDALYETWIRRSCEGYADHVVVADVDGRALGYVTCHAPAGQSRGQIGLVGVSAAARGLGLGSAMIREATGWFSATGRPSVSVVTQGRNTRAQRLYQRCGFVTRSLHLWYHWWSAGNPTRV